MASVAPKFTLPESPRRYRFVLTPLADAMFQLLIFFMLSSNLAPYALLTIRGGAEGNVANTNGARADGVSALQGNIAIWNVREDGVMIRGQTFAYANLGALADAVGKDNASILLILRDAATVQHLARVLEALTVAGVTNVQVAEPAS